jgi:hypothetical protein
MATRQMRANSQTHPVDDIIGAELLKAGQNGEAGRRGWRRGWIEPSCAALRWRAEIS